MSGVTINVLGSLAACVWLITLHGVDSFAQETADTVKGDPKAARADGRDDLRPWERGVAGLHRWKASDYFDSEQALLACDAIYWRRTEELSQMIENGLDVNVRKSEGITLLHWAVASNSFECFKILLEAGADPDAPLKTSLWTKREAGFDTPIFYGRDTILHSCARRAIWEKYFFEGLKYCQKLDLPGTGGHRLTNIACSSDGSPSLLAVVLAAGASPDFADGGQSGYVGALISGDYEMIRVLLDYKADPLYGDVTADWMLKTIDERIRKYTEMPNDFNLGVLRDLRQAAAKRAEQLKEQKPPNAVSREKKR